MQQQQQEAIRNGIEMAESQVGSGPKGSVARILNQHFSTYLVVLIPQIS